MIADNIFVNHSLSVKVAKFPLLKFLSIQLNFKKVLNTACPSGQVVSLPTGRAGNQLHIHSSARATYLLIHSV